MKIYNIQDHPLYVRPHPYAERALHRANEAARDLINADNHYVAKVISEKLDWLSEEYVRLSRRYRPNGRPFGQEEGTTEFTGNGGDAA